MSEACDTLAGGRWGDMSRGGTGWSWLTDDDCGAWSGTSRGAGRLAADSGSGGLCSAIEPTELGARDADGCHVSTLATKGPGVEGLRVGPSWRRSLATPRAAAASTRVGYDAWSKIAPRTCAGGTSTRRSPSDGEAREVGVEGSGLAGRERRWVLSASNVCCAAGRVADDGSLCVERMECSSVGVGRRLPGMLGIAAEQATPATAQGSQGPATVQPVASSYVTGNMHWTCWLVSCWHFEHCEARRCILRSVVT